MAKNYDSFSSYLQDVYYNQFFSRINAYILKNKGHLDLSSRAVPDPTYVKLDDFHIKSVIFHEAGINKISCKATVQADIEIHGQGRYDYEDNSVELWLSVPVAGTLNNGLQYASIGEAESYSKEAFKKENALTKYLIPYMYAKDLDQHAEKFLKRYCPEALEKPMPLPIKEIINAMDLVVYPAPLPDGVFGKTYFNNATVEVYTDFTEEETVTKEIEPGTILVNPDVFFMRNIGSVNNTVIHECVHWDKHHNFFELQKILNPDSKAISCAVVEDYKKGKNNYENALSWMEWQANSLAPRILIPVNTGRQKLKEILADLHRTLPGIRNAEIMEIAIHEFADFFNVSVMAAKIRAIDLGFEQAAGVYNYIDGKKYPPFSFSVGSLKKNQTFVIDVNNAIFESYIDAALQDDINNNRFIHAQGVFVINNPKYVEIDDDAEATLTDYALEHMDECCLVFDRNTRVSTNYDDSFYRICFLCRDVDSKCFVEAKFNPHEGKNEDVQKRAREMAAIAAEATRVSDILDEIPSSFRGTLDFHINRRGYTNEKMEERTGISSRMIQDYRNKKDQKITLPSVLALCIGLNLQPAFSYDLIAKAGYNIMTFTKDNLVYRYLIDNHHMENIVMWNEKLREAGINQQLPKNGNKLTAPEN